MKIGCWFIILGLVYLFATSAHARELSCEKEVGTQQATKLVNECIEISPATHPPCNMSNSCNLVVSEIVRGCAFDRQVNGKSTEGFCSKYLQDKEYEKIRATILLHPSANRNGCRSDNQIDVGNFYAYENYATAVVSCVSDLANTEDVYLKKEDGAWVMLGQGKEANPVNLGIPADILRELNH